MCKIVCRRRRFTIFLFFLLLACVCACVEEEIPITIETLPDDTLLVIMSFGSTGNVAEDEQTLDEARIDIAASIGVDESRVVIVNVNHASGNDATEEGEESIIEQVLNVQYIILDVNCGDGSLEVTLIENIEGIQSVDCHSVTGFILCTVINFAFCCLFNSKIIIPCSHPLRFSV